MNVKSLALIAVAATALAGCAKSGEIDASGGITAVRSACPIVGVPAGTGDVTLFDPPASRDENAIDVVANMTNVRGTCDDTGTDVVTTVNFEVRGRRTRTDAARDVVLPYFITIVRGGSSVIAKRVSQVNLHFDAGQATASTTGQATSMVSRAAATLPDDVRKELTKPRKAGDQDAAVDPLSTPAVRQAVLRASFEAMVGFQLTNDQLRYNAVR
ncbi:conserved exported hypothetical protein [Sphingomonas sp. EC-HK361]|uniref:hypothetical protein n=1 Tax=Sphingomonas sp. EC-HK361 TaxID=2038397 RepID=UPI0012576B47|nr:hypothetical protein [Sphingomonas sp. EC-HK361]VVT23374.1 conserved exported hypothetical protein [Sphingomonas sp. EC-HK361]